MLSPLVWSPTSGDSLLLPWFKKWENIPPVKRKDFELNQQRLLHSLKFELQNSWQECVHSSVGGRGGSEIGRRGESNTLVDNPNSTPVASKRTNKFDFNSSTFTLQKTSLFAEVTPSKRIEKEVIKCADDVVCEINDTNLTEKQQFSHS